MKRPFIIAACLFLSGCAAFPFHGSREVSGVQAADALSETWPADAEHFASQAALELSRRYPAGQTGLSLVTVQGQFGTSLENQLRGHGFAIFPSDSSSGVRVGYVLDEIIGEITPTGYLQIRTSDGTAFSMIRKLMGGLPSTASQAPALPAPVSTESRIFCTLPHSPACKVNGMPSAFVFLNSSMNSDIGYRLSAPARSAAHTPCPRYSLAVRSIRAFSSSL